jgi:ferredoxin-like protein FixX
MISPVGYTGNLYPAVGSNAIGQPVNAVSKVNVVNPLDDKKAIGTDKAKPSECQTCKNRKYVDKSNDNVSYKTPTHISPSASYAAVSAHEQEHVSSAISEGSKEGNQLISTSVSLKVEVCPECGTSYVSGGLTTTQMQYTESNPYESSRKPLEASFLKGMYVDAVA